MRYFVRSAYKGSQFHGWQIQPNSRSVQQTIEEAFSLLLRQDIGICGCGRTDTGVHASDYLFHFDFDGTFPEHFLYRLNKILPDDIAIFHIWQVEADAHARFDASQRRYAYHLNWQKRPFASETSWYLPEAVRLDRQAMQEAAQLLLEYDSFFPFCKTHSDAKTMHCQLMDSRWEWIEDEQRAVYHIAANRFLRGMVRLIVGSCIYAGRGQLSLEELREALDQQHRLRRSYSAPPQGLFLTHIVYPGEAQWADSPLKL
ncbi:MAG: tRNA pseudouridine(38-40) synthase TruA [Bacteroidota bacterium]